MKNKILHLPAMQPSEQNPLSADVYAVRGKTAWWIFDVGACDEAADFVKNLPCENPDAGEPLKKNIVISHFHRDHTFNLPRVHFDNLYVGRETYRHCGADILCRGNVSVVENPLEFDDDIHICIEPIPNSHAKGSLMLSAGQIAFLGDSTYPMVGHAKPDSYNAQLLYEQIKFLRECSTQQFYMSHKRFIAREKDSVVQFLESIYARRRPKENSITDF